MRPGDSKYFDSCLQKVLEDPAKNWKTLPAHYKLDKRFVVQVIEKAKQLPPKCDFERAFPQSLRFDRSVVLAFCGRADFEQIYQDRHLFVPGCLTNDKQVMMAYCSKIPRQLQECSEELCEDRDVVLTAVRRNGLELQYASHCLQHDEEIMRIACSLDGRALEFCPLGPTRDKLLNDREFLVAVMRNNGAGMLRLLNPSELRKDPELLLTAMEHGLHWRYCPRELKDSTEFIIKAVSRKATLYNELPLAWMGDPVIAEAAVKSSSSTECVIDKAVQLCPQILQIHLVAMAAVQRGSLSFVKKFLTEDHPAYLSDKHVMLHALLRDNTLYSRCRNELQQDVDIVMAAIQESSVVSVLLAVGNTWLLRFPQAAVKAVSVVSPRSLTNLRPLIPDELWNHNREVVLAWLKKGGRVLPQFERLVRNDVEMALTVAEHVPRDFIMVDEALRSNLDFMEKAVDRSGKVLRFCGNSLRTHKELAVRAVANYAFALQRDGPISKQELQQFVESQMELRERFVRDFLRGIALSQQSRVPPSLRCALPMLDRGTETGTALKMVIAEFLGIPVGEKLKVYRKCLNHLVSPPPKEPEDRLDEMAVMDRVAGRRFMIRRMREGRDHDMDRWEMILNFRADMHAGAVPGINIPRNLLPVAAPVNNGADAAPAAELLENAPAVLVGAINDGMLDRRARREARFAGRMAPRARMNNLEDDLAIMFAFEQDEMMEDIFAGFDVEAGRDAV